MCEYMWHADAWVGKTLPKGMTGEKVGMEDLQTVVGKSLGRAMDWLGRRGRRLGKAMAGIGQASKIVDGKAGNQARHARKEISARENESGSGLTEREDGVEKSVLGTICLFWFVVKLLGKRSRNGELQPLF